MIGTAVKEVTVNEGQKLYCIPSGAGYSCLGFDVLLKRARALVDEMGLLGWEKYFADSERGTLAAYRWHEELCAIGAARHKETGWRSKAELTPELIGLEGKRVEVIRADGEKKRFWVGKSTGWLPCHLEIARRNCYGGGAVWGAPFQSVRVVR